MSHRSLFSIAASVIIGIACVATVSTDAFAYRRGVGVGVGRPGVRVVAPVRRGVAVGVGVAAGAAVVHGAHCGYYPVSYTHLTLPTILRV